MNLTLDAATADDAATLERWIAPADAAELAACGMSVQEALHGVSARALRHGDYLVCLFGAEPLPGVCDVGVPWMLCTKHLQAVPRRAMAAVSAAVVAAWRGEFRRLNNLVHRHNNQSIRFVEWLGFTVHREPTGPGGAFFVFEWEKSDV